MSNSELHLIDAAPLRCLLSVPQPPPDAVGPVPVLCFLHGYDEAAPAPIREGVTRHGPLAAGVPASVAERFLVVAPQLPVAGDLWHRSVAAVDGLVERVLVLHGGDPDRVYLTGFSFGGNGVFDLALALRDRWAALWAVDPTRVPAEDPGLPVWLSSGEISRRRAAAWVERLDLAPVSAAEPPGRGVYRDRGLGHVGTATAAYRDPRIYDWLLGYRR